MPPPINGPGNAYKPIPPPKPKNYKPPHKGGYPPNDALMQPPLPYQHGKSHSNPVVCNVIVIFFLKFGIIGLKFMIGNYSTS